MKQLKRLTALVLSVAMVLSMGLSAFANTEVGPVCSQSEGCVDGAHGADCALYEEPATTEETTEEEPTTEEPVDEEQTTEEPAPEESEELSGSGGGVDPNQEGTGNSEPATEEPESETPPVETPAVEQPAPEEPVVTCDGTADCKASENHQEGCLAVQAPPVQPLAEPTEQSEWEWRRKSKDEVVTEVSVRQGWTVGDYAPFVGEQNLFEGVTDHELFEVITEDIESNLRVRWSPKLMDRICVEALPDCPVGSYTLEFKVAGAHYTLPVRVTEGEFDYSWRLASDRDTPREELILSSDNPEQIRFELFRDDRCYPKPFEDDLVFDPGTTSLEIDYRHNIDGVGSIVLEHENAQPGVATLTYLRDDEPKATITITVVKEIGYQLQYKLNDAETWSEIGQLDTVKVGDKLTIRALKIFGEGVEPEEILIDANYHLWLKDQSGNNDYDFYWDDAVCQDEDNYAVLRIPYYASGVRLYFETFGESFEEQQAFSFSVEKLPGAFELQTWRSGEGDEGTWDAVNEQNPAEIEVGKSGFFRVMYVEEGKEDVQMPLNLHFHVGGSSFVGTKIHGNDTAELYAVSAPTVGQRFSIRYGVGDDPIRFRDCVSITGESFVWEVDGEELPNPYIDVTKWSDKTVTVGLKQGEKRIPLTPENSQLSYGYGVLHYNNDGTVTITAKSRHPNLLYFLDGDTTKPLEFEVINNEVGPYFQHDTLGFIDSFTFHAFENPEEGRRDDPGQIHLRLQDGPNGTINANQMRLENFTILGEDGESIGDLVGNKIVCDFFTVDQENGLTVRATGNGTATLRYKASGYKESPETRYGYLMITVDVQEHSYALYSDDGKPFAIDEGSYYSEHVVTPYGLRLREMNKGVPGADLTDKILDIIPGEAYDERNGNSPYVWDGDPAHTDNCALWIGQDEEGQWTVYARNLAMGQYHLPLKIKVAGLSNLLDFELIYTVIPDESRIGYYYVSAKDSAVHLPSDFDNIQAALDAAKVDVNVKMRYVVLRAGTYEGEEIDGPGGDGQLELKLNEKIDGSIGYSYFGMEGENNEVVIRGSLNYSPDGRDPLALRYLKFQSPETGKGTAIRVNQKKDRGFYPGITLQNVEIEGYETGVDGDIYAEKSSNVSIQGCNVGLKLNYRYRDTSLNVLRNLNFNSNGTAIELTESSRGQFKIRQSYFIYNDKDIVANESECEYINAAFNDYDHGVSEKESISKFFQFRAEDNAHFLYSPHTRQGKEVKGRAVAASDYLIDPEQMNGLIIDADEAKQVINSSNFKDQNISIDIVTTVENEETGLTESKPYATWNFGKDVTASAESMDFTPRIDLELPEESQSVVEKAGVTNYQPVSFLHSGELPATATVNVTATEELSGNLYLYKVEGDKLVLQEEKVTFQNGEYTFDRPTCSDYIITDKLLNGENIGNTTQSTTVDTTDDRDDEEDDNDYISGGEVEEELSETKGDKATISVTKRNKVAKKAFAELAKTDKTLVLRGEGYSWSIEGSEITKPLAAAYFKTGVRSSSPYARKIDKLVDTLNYQIIQTEHHGELPGKMTLRLKVKDELRHSLCYLYYYNSTTGKAEAIASGLKADGKGYVEIVFDEHLSTYFLTDKPLRGAVNSLSASGDKVNPGTGAY